MLREFVAPYNATVIDKLNEDIDMLLELKEDDEILDKLKEMIPEFNHNKTGGQK